MFKSRLSKTLLVSAMLAGASFVSSFGHEIPVIPSGNPGDDGDIIFRAPAFIPIYCDWSEQSSTISVYFLANLGTVSVEIENQTTGEYSQSTINALAGATLFPISGTAGNWTIRFTLSNNQVYLGTFTI